MTNNSIKVAAQFDGPQAAKIMKALERMPFNLARRQVGQIMKRAFRPAYNTMRSKAPVRTGSLRKSIGTITFFSRSTNSWVVRLGPRYKGKNKSYTAHFAELGVKPKLKRTRGQFTFFGKGGKVIKTKQITSGTRKQPFVRPTLEKYRDVLPFRVAKGVREFLVSEFKKSV